MTFYFLTLFGFYFVLLLVLRIGWSKAFALKEKNPILKKDFISVVIPIRNEERNIGTLVSGLANQNYEASNFEVIVVNDHSTDDSIQRTKEKQEIFTNLTTLSLGENEFGKKAALTRGISFAKGEIVATTDADCILPPEWLATINSAFQNDQINMAAGMVKVADDKKFFSRWQAMEFASVMGTGAAAFGFNKPFMCNGANLSFRKEVFHKVNGYEGNEHIASGDDEFLMRKIHDRFPDSIRMMNSIVVTQPQVSPTDFLQQRIRWASKWKGNPSIPAKLLAVFIFLLEASWVFLISFLNHDHWVLLLIVVVKIAADLLFLLPVFRFMKIKFTLISFLGLQFLYPFYVILVGLLAPWSSYRWKDRKIL